MTALYLIVLYSYLLPCKPTLGVQHSGDVQVFLCDVKSSVQVLQGVVLVTTQTKVKLSHAQICQDCIVLKDAQHMN